MSILALGRKQKRKKRENRKFPIKNWKKTKERKFPIKDRKKKKIGEICRKVIGPDNI